MTSKYIIDNPKFWVSKQKEVPIFAQRVTYWQHIKEEVYLNNIWQNTWGGAGAGVTDLAFWYRSASGFSKTHPIYIYGHTKIRTVSYVLGIILIPVDIYMYNVKQI